ncbi:MAG: adenine deaminase [Bdellovibrionales bacterium]|nr:adenine deaminase [Bdellovibrionales bacterium]
MKSSKFSSNLQARMDASMGRIPCDLLLKNGRVFDVFSARFVKTDLAIHQGVIVGLDRGYQGKREVDLKGKAVVPGFIDAHVHIESSAMVPGTFEKAVLPKGTTRAICDPHELANVLGRPGIQFFLDAAERTQMDLHIMMSSCVPATHLETNGGGSLEASVLSDLSRHPRALGLAEMMNVPGVLNHDPSIHEKLSSFYGRPIDGHAPMLSGRELSAYACAGITSCHESSELLEAEEKLQKGVAVWIREGSVAKDLHRLIPLLNPSRSLTVGFCTDDRNPLDIQEEGHLDFLVRESLKAGVAPEVAYRAASFSVARHYGLDRITASNLEKVGALAPGYVADLIVLDDEFTCAISQVYKKGVPVSELAFDPSLSRAGQNEKFEKTVHASVPSVTDLTGPSGNVHVMEVIPGKILTGRRIDRSDASGVARLSVLERHGKGLKPANAYVSGFGSGFRGAIASSVGHDSHNLIVVGSDPKEMQVALSHLISSQGGFVVVQGEKVLADLPLPFGGLMSDRSSSEIIQGLKALRAASRSVGCELAEPFLQLAFLSLPVIPSLKLTDRGLVDVQKFDFISVSA